MPTPINVLRGVGAEAVGEGGGGAAAAGGGAEAPSAFDASPEKNNVKVLNESFRIKSISLLKLF